IRDRNVTGVQTCALPIWDECTIQGMNGLDYIKTTKANRDKKIAEKEKGINDQNAQARNALKAHKLPKSYYDDTYCWCVISLEERSEERRVGKESRTGRWQ